jgi:type IV conjugative transfer system protein TraL
MKRDSRKWRIPQRLDEPKRILFFSVTEIFILFGALFGGLLINKLVYGLMAAGATIMFLRRFSLMLKGHSPSVMAYWFFGVNHNRHIPASWKRHWRG